MPSPFPGMDPFIELYDWGDFHVSLIVEIKRQLAPQLHPKYFSIIGERYYVERSVRPRALAVHPYAVSLPPEPVEQTEPNIAVIDEGGNRCVTVIELLSPANKQQGTDGHSNYLRRRKAILRDTANLVEIDLLRSGTQLSTERTLRSTTDFRVLVHHNPRRPTADVYQWTLRQSLPTIRVPLAGREADVHLDLQAAFDAVWDYSNFADRLDYSRFLTPPVSPADEAWLQSILNARRQL